MRRAGTGQDQAHRDRPVVGRIQGLLQGRADPAQQCVDHGLIIIAGACRYADIDLAPRPAQHIEVAMLDFGDGTIGHGHQGTALGTGLADMPALDIAREYDPRLVADDFTGMHMAQRPILIALAAQAVDRARGIGHVARLAVQAGMQQADGEPLRVSLRIAGGEVVADRAGRKALADDGDADLVEHLLFGVISRELMDIVRQAQVAGDAAGGVVIAGDQEYRDTGTLQAVHALYKVQPGVVILPIAVIEVAGEQHEVHGFVDGQVDEIIKRAPGRAADLGDRRAFVALQAQQGAVEVDVGGVEEFHEAGISTYSPSLIERPG